MTGLTAIVAHDTGGAELLSSHVRRLPPARRAQHLFVLEGPARAVFARKLGQFAVFSLDEALVRADALLCGTGWQSELELEAIECARALGKRSTAFLDHWVNYRARFERAGRLVLPDELWVGDELALKCARQELPELPARIVSNPYLADLQEQLAARTDTCGTGITFLCEPVREHALRQHGDERHWGYTEEDALRYFLNHLPALPQPELQPRIVVRLHPSEAPGKYDALLAQYQLPIETSAGGDLLDDILRSRWVAGCNTMGLVVALLAGRQALCCIPPGGRPCVLPHRQIVHLQDLVGVGQ